MSKQHHVTTTINGEPIEFLCEAQQTLLDVLRDELASPAARKAAARATAAPAASSVDGRLVCSCLMLGGRGRRPQDHDRRGHGARATTCTRCSRNSSSTRRCNAVSARPGFIVAAKALLERNPNPTEDEMRYWLAGNLCRCTGYDKIVRAVLDAAAEMRGA